MLKNKRYVYSEGKLAVPAHLNFGQEVLENMMMKKNVVALINSDTDERITYGELAQQVVDIALSLARIGVRKGDVVSICSEKRMEYMPTILGIMCAGATFASSDNSAGTRSLLHRVIITKPKVMFLSSSEYKNHIADFRTMDCIKTFIVYGDEPQPGTVLFKDFLTEHASVEDFQPVPVDGSKHNLLILFSSGTTGLPKGIPHTHLGVMVDLKHTMLIDRKDCDATKKMFNTREWCYSYGLMYTLAYLAYGGTMVYCRDYSIKSFLEAIQKYKIERIQLAPSTVTEFIKSPIIQNYDLTSLELIVSASTTLMGETIDTIKRILPGLKEVLQLYGISETGIVCTDAHAQGIGTKTGSVGLACPGFIVKVVDPDTKEPLGPNQRGEICCKSPSITAGYLNSNISDAKDDEGFYKTGDMGYYDEDRYFFIVDRIKEMIKFNDCAIAPAEFESILEQHESVKEAGVVGAPHEVFGQVPLAFVALRPGATATEDQLVQHVNSQVSHRIQLAGGVRFVKSLPRGAGDKLDRKALKQMLAQ